MGDFVFLCPRVFDAVLHLVMHLSGKSDFQAPTVM